VILVKIDQIGDVACHTGARSCFFTEVEIPQSYSALRSDFNQEIS